MAPDISVVTICFNNLEDVKKTCASVDMQEQKPYEHIIIDGSTKEDIKNYLNSTPQPGYRKWICEPDKGISDAFNKGLKKAVGPVTTLLNSGDVYYDSTILKRVSDAFSADETLMWTNGKLNLNRSGLWSVVGKPFEKSKLYRGMHGVFHPTMFVKKEVYERRGYFDLSLKYAMDYDIICRIADEKSGFIDYPIATFDNTGISSKQYLKATDEMFRCYQKYYGVTLKQKLWEMRLVTIHHLLNSKLGKLLYRLKVKSGMQKV